MKGVPSHKTPNPKPKTTDLLYPLDINAQLNQREHPPKRHRGHSATETDVGDTATAKHRPTEASKKQRNQEDLAKWRARRAEKRRRGQAPGYFRDSGYRG